ncbi:hypothetical protein L207DRAFT_501981 [Hyaloscypha variabilis F]|uniref:Indole-diterpene biosynthesis protein-like protein PaxU n=1 Tax=Hyaloscypha variabilis (strain UAMH 11265 / GT02V1 / F) TaxID=1149755 RepID=A0A2J6QXQ6_HYAVF|nr:hypothetical protein L207DRAFT_501981 [Hyaloscypha variabilis F]
MATASPSPPNLEFQKLSKTIFLYTPPTPAPANSTDPTTIIFCQWMGISPKSRSLNTVYNQHHTLFPHSRIVTIRSLPEYFSTASESTRRGPLKQIISAIDSDPAPEKRILVHLFSNGGTQTFTDICDIYRKGTGHVLPVKAITFDSCPGRPTATEGWAALSLGLPNGLLWYPIAATIWLALGIQAFVRNWLGIPTFLDRIFPKLNDWSLVDRNAKRLYVWSEGDKIVAARDPREHARLAREEGVSVVTLEEKDLAHMTACVKDGERYWGAVSKLWESAK